MRLFTQSDGERLLREFNKCHLPGGAPTGGQFCSAPDAGSGGGPSDRLQRLLTGWTEGGYDWTEMQHAARAVIEGAPRKDYACYDCRGDDKKRYDDAQFLLKAIEAAPPVPKTLYRGLKGARSDFKVGTEFSEGMTSWTGKRALAEKFAKGEYHPWRQGGEVVMVFESYRAKGLAISSTQPIYKDADEYLTSGAYRVVARGEGRDGTIFVKVRRVGPARQPPKGYFMYGGNSSHWPAEPIVPWKKKDAGGA